MEYIVEIEEVVVSKFRVTAHDAGEAETVVLEGYLDGSIQPDENNVDSRVVHAWAQA
jgi:hypothetical protein